MDSDFNGTTISNHERVNSIGANAKQMAKRDKNNTSDFLNYLKNKYPGIAIEALQEIFDFTSKISEKNLKRIEEIIEFTDSLAIEVDKAKGIEIADKEPEDLSRAFK